ERRGKKRRGEERRGEEKGEEKRGKERRGVTMTTACLFFFPPLKAELSPAVGQSPRPPVAGAKASAAHVCLTHTTHTRLPHTHTLQRDTCVFEKDAKGNGRQRGGRPSGDRSEHHRESALHTS